MLLISRIDIRNFVVFDRTKCDLSIDEGSPATIIRAENSSGKTTFLRAVRWGFYGEDGLPGADTRARDRWGLQPLEWSPEQGNVETSVTITFWTDGASRQQEAEGVDKSQFRLKRTVTTIPHSPASAEDPPFRRIGHAVSLMRKNVEGDWVDFDRDPDEAVKLLLPIELKDFYFVDADEATDEYIGGEDHASPQHTIIDNTTKAVKELLGLGVVDDAVKRLGDQAAEFRKQASRAAGDKDIDEMQHQLDANTDLLQGKEQQLELMHDEITDLEAEVDDQDAKLQDALKRSGDPDGLAEQKRAYKASIEAALRERRDLLSKLTSALEAPELLGALALPSAQSVHEVLHADHDKGLIPMSHLSFVRERLDSGECLCGEPLTHGSDLRRRVEETLRLSSEREDRANLLGETFRAVDDLLRDAKSDNYKWAEVVDDLEGQLGEVDGQIGQLKLQAQAIDEALSRDDGSRIRSIQAILAERRAKLEDDLIPNAAVLAKEIESLKRTVQSQANELHQRTKQRAAAQQASNAQQLALALQEALTSSYQRIQRDQVKDLSDTMGKMFQQMVADISADDVTDEQGGSNLRAFDAVGIEPTPKDPNKYRIFARDEQGRTLASTEINGASRRVLATSFILALAKESGTQAPLFADSLLNPMSGVVRLNTLQAAAANARQPVLLLTRDDIGNDEAALIDKVAGKTYTFTAGWEPQVVNRDVTSRRITVLCACGPRNYCQQCERSGDRDRRGWTRREDGT